MIDITYTAGKSYQLREIKTRDFVDLAEMWADWPDDGNGMYNLGHAIRDVRLFQEQNKLVHQLPSADPLASTLVLVVDGEVVGVTRVGLWFSHAHIRNTAIHPDFRGLGYFTVMQSMLRMMIEPMGIKSISFESLASSPQVDAHAADHLELAPVETRTGDTGQVVTKYEFTADAHVERLKDPNHAAELIDVAIVGVAAPAPAVP